MKQIIYILEKITAEKIQEWFEEIQKAGKYLNKIIYPAAKFMENNPSFIPIIWGTIIILRWYQNRR